MILLRCTCGELVPAHLQHEHKCAQNISPKRKPSAKPVPKTAMSSSPSPSSRRTVKPPEPVITPPTRFQKWHAKNRETHNARMRAYRARQKAPE